MTRHGAMGLIGVVAMALSSVGCVSLEEHQELQRAYKTLQEDHANLQNELLACESSLAQKDERINSLEQQLATLELLVGNLEKDRDSWRAQAEKALEELGKMEAQPPVVIERTALPEPVDKALKDLEKQYGDLLTYDPEKGAVRWKSDLLFPLGSDQLASSGEVVDALKKFAEIVGSAAAAKFDVIIVGHTCTTPIGRPETLREHKTNWHLSAHRSISVMNMLSEAGTPMTRMGVMGYGEYRPIADNGTTEGKARNRRVEIYLVPAQSVQAVGMGVFEVDGMELMFASAAR